MIVGHNVPRHAALLLEYNKRPDIKPINLKSIAVTINFDSLMKTHTHTHTLLHWHGILIIFLYLDISVQASDYLWTHGAVSDETFMLLNAICNFWKLMREYAHDQWSQIINIT